MEVAAPAVKTSGYQVSPIVSSNDPCSVSSSSCSAAWPVWPSSQLGVISRLSFWLLSLSSPRDSSLVAGGSDGGRVDDAGVVLLRNALNP